MSIAEQYINSGILDLYVIGLTSEEENLEISRLAEEHPEIRREIDELTDTAMELAEMNAPALNPAVKPMIMATINYTQRLQSGEQPSNPPMLSSASAISEYSEWLQRPDFTLPDSEEIHARIIGNVPGAMTAIVWMRVSSPFEVHDAEYERFLIVEGTCNITVGDDVHSLQPGDYLQIPLHVGHSVKVTSLCPCKVILQRVAA